MRKLLLILITAAFMLPLPVAAQDGAVTVHGFTAAHAAAADPITISGPATAKSGETITCRIIGTPAVDLTKPLVDQLAWLMGDDQMFVYVAIPDQAAVPLDVEGTIVFGATGATMRPQVSFPAGEPGEYRLIVDWNFGQNQLVEHVVTVEGDDVNPPLPPVPPLPPLSQVYIWIVTESDDQMSGLEGAKLTNHLEEVKEYLRSLPVDFQVTDQQKPIAKRAVDFLNGKSIPSRPALVVSVPARAPSDMVGAVSFAGSADKTIQALVDMGVKK